MKPVTIGKSANRNVKIDLLRLVDTRMLVQASSGGGKSWLLRKLCELAAPHVQVIVIDPEGEFSTLREKFDFLLVGDGGELKPEVRSAGLLARKLVQTRVSSVIDLYELKYVQRRDFVAAFLESLMSVPKKMWHEILIVLDEAHVFAPEGGKKAVASSQAVIDLMTQGRKRGFCGLLATQRLSSLSKDAAAMGKNVMIGSTTLDVDLVRAGATLGLSGKDRNVLMHLDPGQFYGFGPAFDFKGVGTMTIGGVTTTHPETGKRRTMTVPSPSKVIKGVLGEFKDLPEEADKEIKDMADALAKIKELQTLVRKMERQVESAGSTSDVDAQQLRAMADDAQQQLATYKEQTDVVIARLATYAGDLVTRLSSIAELLMGLPEPPEMSIDVKGLNLAGTKTGRFSCKKPNVSAKPTTRLAEKSPASSDNGESFAIEGKIHSRILNAIAWWESADVREPTRAQVSVVAGAKGGYFARAIGELKTQGLVDYPSSGRLSLSSAAAVMIPPRPTYDDLCDRIRSVIGDGMPRKIFDVVAAHPNAELSREEVATECDVTAEGGYFARIIGQLKTMGLLQYPQPGYVSAGPVLSPFL